MRQISFSLTTPQFIAGNKTVTRRLGWGFVRVGDRLQAVERARGIKKGDKVKKIGVIEVTDVRLEPLASIGVYDSAELEAEGFPFMTPQEFVKMFCEANHCQPTVSVTRITFRRVPG